MEVLPELEPPFRTITGFTRSTIAGRCKEAPVAVLEPLCRQWAFIRDASTGWSRRMFRGRAHGR